MTGRWLLATACAAMLAFPTAARSEDGAPAARTGVAVLDFDPQNAPAADASIITEYVRQALVARSDFTVVDRKNMTKTLQEQAIQQTGCTSSECAVKLGKVLNVQKIVVGTYGVMEGGFRVMTAQVVDVQTSQIEKSAKEKGFQVSNADEAAESLVAKLFGEGGTSPATPVTPAGAAASPAGGAPDYNALLAQRYAASRTENYVVLYGGTAFARAMAYSASHDYQVAGTFSNRDVTDAWGFSALTLRNKTPDAGLRMGGWGRHFGGDAEFFYGSRFTPAQTVDQEITEVGDPAGGLTLTTTQTALPERYLVIDTFGFGGNLLLHTGGRVQFYGGLGMSMAWNRFGSDYIIPDATTGEALQGNGLSFGGHLPLGLRCNVKGGFFYVEFREALAYTWFTTERDAPQADGTGTYTETLRRSMLLNAAQLLGGFGVTF